METCVHMCVFKGEWKGVRFGVIIVLLRETAQPELGHGFPASAILMFWVNNSLIWQLSYLVGCLAASLIATR